MLTLRLHKNDGKKENVALDVRRVMFDANPRVLDIELPSGRCTHIAVREPVPAPRQWELTEVGAVLFNQVDHFTFDFWTVE